MTVQPQQEQNPAGTKTSDISSTTFKVVGSFQVIGAVCLVINSLLEILRYIGNPFYYGFWGGLFFAMAGFVTIWTGKTATKHSFRTCVGMSIIAIIMAVFATCSVGILLDRYFKMEGVCRGFSSPSSPEYEAYNLLCEEMNGKKLLVVLILFCVDLFFILLELGLALGISLKCCKALHPVSPSNEECQKLVSEKPTTTQ